MNMEYTSLHTVELIPSVAHPFAMNHYEIFVMFESSISATQSDRYVCDRGLGMFSVRYEYTEHRITGGRYAQISI